MKFSIIVPVYNVEEYLPECLNSILNQEYYDYEIILINDGSTDGSSNICQKYKENYDRIVYCEKTNGGLSEARNFGIMKAKGEYLIFIDSDDWIADGVLSQFDTILNDPVDVLITRLTEVYCDHVIQKDTTFEQYCDIPFTSERAIKWIMKESQNTWPAVKYIVSKKLVEKHQLKFKSGRLHEDLDWTSRVCFYAESYLGFYNEWYYHRMNRDGSITSSIRTKNIIDTIEMTGELFYILNDDKETTKMIKEALMQSVYAKLNEVKKCPKKETSLIVNAIKDNLHIFKVTPGIKYKLFVIAMKIVGPQNALFILSSL